MDKLDRQILNVLQFSFPLVIRPYQAIGREVGCTESEVMRRIGGLKRSGTVRQISPIFDSARLGYTSTLAAFEAAPSKADEAAAVLSAHPGVSHNYLREGDFNVWFTLTLPKAQSLKDEIRRLARRAGAKDWLFLPTVRTFKIGFRLDMTGKAQRHQARVPAREETPGRRMPRVDKAFVRLLQGDLPLTTRPFRRAASRLGLTEGEIVRKLKDYIDAGIVRRFASVLRPTKAGYGANVMVAWAPPPDRIEELGMYAATRKAITHSYQRPTSAKWPYSVYTMIHGKTMKDCRSVIADIKKATGVRAYRELRTLKEYKKVRVVYFEEHTPQRTR